MPGVFPVTHSTLSGRALMAQVTSDYEVGSPVECRLLQRGLNDTYLLRTADDRYILRIYRAGWRSPSEIRYEIDILAHLHAKSVAVSIPLVRKDGRLTGTLQAPEGLRPTALFTYAPGKPSWNDLDEERCRRYGALVAAIHNASDDFVSPYARFSLDLDHLLDRPLTAIAPFLDHRSEDWAYLQELAGTLRERLTSFPPDALESGFCHGDFHGGNAHLTEDGTLTFFDFDCCGPGWRSYDVAVFRWGAALAEKEEERWPPFLKGYREHRSLKDADLEAVPLFVAIRYFWFLGLQTGNAEDWGSAWLDHYFDQALKFLREWSAKQIDGSGAGT